MTRVSRSNPTVYDDQDENYPPRNHAHLAPQRLDKHSHDTGVYPEDENDDFLDKENQPAGILIYEDQHGQPVRRHSRQQLSHQQQQQPAVGRSHLQHHHSQQLSQEHYHSGDTSMAEVSFDAQDVGSASDQENVQPCPSTPPAVTTAAALPADIKLDARDELLLREKYLSQRQSAKTELMERSRDQRQIAAAQQRRQQEQQQQQQQQQRHAEAPPLARQQSGTQKMPLPTQREAPGAPVRKRTRKSMEAEELQQQQQQQQHPEGQRAASQGQGADRLAQEQARRQRARQAQVQNGTHATQQAQPRDDGQRKRVKGQQQPPQQQQQQQQQGQTASHREMSFQEKYDKLVRAIEYGDIYYDSKYEYRNVTLPKIMLSFIDRRFMEFPDNPYCNVLRILTEEEWREVGITMSQYWVNWMRHDPEPHVLLFRRPVGTGTRMKKEAERVAREAQEEKLRLEMEAKSNSGPVDQQQQQQQGHQGQQQPQQHPQQQQQQHHHHHQQQQH
ncbi:hypothetical protein BGZ72_001151 [Mortierella alpina]|nr:hypothetical protein BGZ72_001151 [Mortierella alpina]